MTENIRTDRLRLRPDMNENCQTDNPKKTKKSKKKGKVIKIFTVEVVVSGSDLALDNNPSNPYTLMSEDERLKDLIEAFSLLWAESCQKASRTEILNSEIKSLLINNKNAIM